MRRLKKILAVALCSLVLCFDAGSSYVYASEIIATLNPLFIPISILVATVAVGSGIIAKNSEDAINGANQLVQNVISNIKASEIKKSEADSSYVSPFTVINGGKPEKPSNDNKNGKWVALGAGALAAHEIWTNKEAVQSIMSEIYKLNGYNKTIIQSGVKNVSDTNLLSTSNASGIALQLAQYGNRLNTQFTAILNSDVFNNTISQYGMNKDDLVYAVTFLPTHLASKTENYPRMSLSCIDSSQFTKVRLMYNLGFNTKTGQETSSQFAYSYSYYYLTERHANVAMCIYRVLNNDDASVKIRTLQFTIGQRDSTANPNVSFDDTYYQDNIFYARNPNRNTLSDIAYVGFKWASENPWTFTNNVYNSTQTFNVNFPDWLQQSINLLNQNIDAVRLGIQSLNDPWNNTQAVVQTGNSPSNVINQYINNYYNPENLPSDNPQPEPEPEPNPGADPITVDQAQTALKKLMQQGIDYIAFQIPNNFWNKIPFSIPYDIYLLIHGIFVGSSGGSKKSPRREASSGSNMPVGDPSNVGIEIDIPTVPLKYTEEKTEDTPPNFTFTLNIPYTTPDGQTANFNKEFTIETARYNYFAKIIKFSIALLWLSSVFQWLLAIFSKG